MTVVLTETDALLAALRKYLPVLLAVRLRRWAQNRAEGDALRVDAEDVQIDGDDDDTKVEAWYNAIRVAVEDDRRGDAAGRVVYKAWLYGVHQEDQRKADLAYPKFFSDILTDDAMFTPRRPPPVWGDEEEEHRSPESPLPPVPAVAGPAIETFSAGLYAFQHTIAALRRAVTEQSTSLRDQVASFGQVIGLLHKSYQSILIQKDDHIQVLTNLLKQQQGAMDARERISAEIMSDQRRSVDEAIVRAEKIKSGTAIGLKLIDGINGAAMMALGGGAVPPELVKLVAALDPETRELLAKPETIEALANPDVQALVRDQLKMATAAMAQAKAANQAKD